MKQNRIFLTLTFIIVCGLLFSQTNPAPGNSTATGNKRWVLVVHGGAGGPVKGVMKPEIEKQYTDSLTRALKIGSVILTSGGSSLDAVEAVIRFLEDCPMFNAGRGAVLTHDGRAEMDASIMDGKTGKAGAVACVTTIKNPITAARAVMEKTPHVLFIGQGADDFAKDAGLQIVDPSYFITPERLEAWKTAKMKTGPGRPAPSSADTNKKGTVGCVALDLYGNLAAGTSTGGMMMKPGSRVGDSPIIGAGTWANNNSCAVSSTGHGEYFIRDCAAYSVAVQMMYANKNMEDAARFVIFDLLKTKGGEGGLIAVDKDGNIAMPFSTNAMFRGSISAGTQPEVLIY